MSSPMKKISSGTSTPGLLAFFTWLIRRSFWDLGMKDTEIANYLSLLLANFARTENLYRIRDFRGRRLETAVEMLLEANLSWYSEQWDREKEIRKHIGDYILFMAGIFREWVEKQSCLDHYLEEGRKAYQTVSQYHKAFYQPGSRLYSELSKDFEFYVGALNYMKKTFFRDHGGNDPFLDFDHQLRGLA
ncbi:MAG: hypothetical protein ACETWT_14845 [Thermodesulfobacteriota bacterium]